MELAPRKLNDGLLIFHNLNTYIYLFFSIDSLLFAFFSFVFAWACVINYETMLNAYEQSGIHPYPCII